MNREDRGGVGVGLFLPGVLAALLVAGAFGVPDRPAEGPEVEARLEAWGQGVRERIARRDRLTRQVVTGETDLLVAAGWFRLFDEQATAGVPDAPDPLAHLPGDTAEEKLCYAVLDRARTATFHWGPSERAEVCARLERRIAEARAQGGGRVVLPEW